MSYRIDELMICRIAREVDDSGVTVLGSFTPLAYASYMLAKLTHAPDAPLIGYNAIGMKPVELSLTGAEAASYKGAAAHWTFIENTQTVHLGGRGLVECVSPAQMDGTGAFNTSAIGDYERPKVRLPGGTGSPEVVQNYEKIIAYFGTHSTRTLVEKVDFATGGRWPVSPEARRERGLLVGPVWIITPLAVLVKDTDDEGFRIESLHPGVSADEVVANTGFALIVPDDIPTTEVPTEEQLELLRTQIDPFGTSQFDFLDSRARAAYIDGILRREWERAEALPDE
jgi:acyl CoA:acetate/3-ketoacid CoA transferase beta subunit